MIIFAIAAAIGLIGALIFGGFDPPTCEPSNYSCQQHEKDK